MLDGKKTVHGTKSEKQPMSVENDDEWDWRIGEDSRVQHTTTGGECRLWELRCGFDRNGSDDVRQKRQKRKPGRKNKPRAPKTLMTRTGAMGMKREGKTPPPDMDGNLRR